MPAQTSPEGNRSTSSVSFDIASSNATANAFLGARQPSWMSGGVPKPNSRPPPARPTRPQAVPKQPTQTQPVLPSPTPSDEPSPAVSNPLDSPNPRHASLTEKQSMVPPGVSGSNSAPVTDARFVPEPTPEQYAMNGSVWARAGYNGHLQSPSIASPPFIGPGHPGGVLASPQVSAVSPLLSAPQTVPNGQIPGAPHHGPMQSPRYTEPPPSAQPGQHNSRQLKRRRTDQNHFSFSNFQPRITEYIQRCGGEPALSNDIERPRLQLLSDACSREDGFFIALHQIYLLWSNSPPQVYAIVHVPPPTVDSAFAIIETVLKKNQLISTGHREWFANFPGEINMLMQSHPPYRSAVAQVARFLEQLANHFKTLAEKSVSRRYPYLVDELLYYLACYSPVLQMIFFTASRRRLGVMDGQMGVQIEAIFRDDQRRHVDSSTGLQVLKPVMAAGEIEKRNLQIIELYKGIVGEATKRLQSAPRTLLPRSGTGSTPQPTPSNQGGGSPYNLAMPFSPNLTGQPQSQLSSPVMVNSPMTQPGTPVQLPQQYILPSSTQSLGQPLPYAMQGAQQHPSYIEEQIRRYQHQQQQLGQLRYQQQSLQQPPHLGQHAAQQAAQQNQQPLQRTQNMNHQQIYTQQSSQIDLRARQPGLQPTFINPVPTAQNQVHMQVPQQNLGTSSISTLQSRSGPTTSFVNNVAPPASRARQAGRTASQSIRQNSVRHFQDRPFMVQGYQIPIQEMPRDPSEHKAIFMSLHQAHVRSPKRVVSMAGLGRYYQAAKPSFPIRPTPIVPRSRIQEFRFFVTPEQYETTSRSFIKQGELLPTVEHFDGSLRWRVRCCKIKTPDKVPTEEQWCATDMSWPPRICMKFNGKVLDIRRRSHNGKDLPVELTDMVVREWNVLQVVLPNDKNVNLDPHFLAVEVLETLSHGRLLEMVHKTGFLGEDHTLEIIKQRINRPLDDDIAFSTSSLPIDLADPFSAVIFKVPARGSECTHLECFDLENFLSTRLPPKTTSRCIHQNVKCSCPPMPEPSNPDKWRCPICSRDARPYSLRIDGFLVKVRSDLEAQNKLHAKSMEVYADGTWKVVLEAEDDIDDSEDEGPPPAKKRAAPTPAKEIEVIEID